MAMQISRPVRLVDWQDRLTGYLASVSRAALRPGQHDCALFAADAVEAMTGADLAADFRGQYRDYDAGQALLEAGGFADHIDLVRAIFPAIAASRAAPGDIAVMPSDDGRPALGIFQGAGVYCLGRRGLVVVSRLNALEGFSV